MASNGLTLHPIALNGLYESKKPLKRECLDCCATDRKRQRACADPKPPKAALETEDEKMARKEAKRIRDEVNKLAKPEQQKWYKMEKTKRACVLGHEDLPLRKIRKHVSRGKIQEQLF